MSERAEQWLVVGVYAYGVVLGALLFRGWGCM
jgi:hypothetical protein